MSVSSSWDLASDAELITAVRSGETAAFGVLYERHAGAAHAVARQYSNTAADADDAVADAFHKVFSTIQNGGGPDVAFRAYLFTVVRRVAMVRVQGGRRVQATDDLETFEAAFGPGEATEEPTLAGFERGVVSRAYSSLPERWQAVLWYTEVERLTPAEIAPVLGLTANGVAALAYRAREGLRQAYLQQHLAGPRSEACTLVNSKLGAYVRGGLAKRETALVESHLDECGDCRALVLELGDVNHGMRAFIAPLVVGGIALTVLQGLGFGGAAGTAGAAAAAGAAVGSGSGVGAGSGASGAGSGAGGSVGVGAGTTAGAGAGTGVGAGAGVGAGSLVGAGAGAGLAAVGGAAALTAALETQSAPAAAATAAGAAGAGSGAAAGGGLAALIASVPVGVLGAAAAGVVVAGSLAVAGALGAFSPDEPDEGVVAEEPGGDQGPGGSDGPGEGDDGEGNDGDEPGGEADPGTDPTDPTNVPPPADVEDGDDAGTTGQGEPTTPPTTPPPTTPPPTTPPPTTPPPTTPPPTTPPPTEPPADPAVVVPSTPDVSSIRMVTGQPTLLALPVTNDGGTAAGEIATQLIFPATADVDVVAMDPPAGGGTVAPVASNGWSCAVVGPVATCTLPDLPAKTTSTLHARLTVTDPSVDGATTMSVGIRTWVVGSEIPDATRVAMSVESPPAVLSVTAPAPDLVLAGSNDELVAAATAFVVTNTGGTSAPAVVTLAGLPSHVDVEVDPAWSCSAVGIGSGLVCTSDAKLPRDGGELPLVVTFTDRVDFTETPEVAQLSASTADGVALVAYSLTPAPARYAVELGQLSSTRDRGGAIDTRVTVRNTGRTSGTDVRVALDVPDGMTLAPASSEWSACGADLCATLPTLAHGASRVLDLRLVAPPGQVAAGHHTLPVTVTDARGVSATGTVAVEVRDLPAPAALAVTAPAELTMAKGVPAVLTATVTNTGGTEATGVVVEADLPAGVTLVPGSGDPYTCAAPGGSNKEVRCAVGVLAPGATATVAFQVRTEGNAGGRWIAVTAAADGGLVAAAPVTTIRMVAGPLLSLSLEPRTTFAPGTPRQLSAGVTNAGTERARDLTMTVQVPASTVWTRVPDSDWSCPASLTGPGEVVCTLDRLDEDDAVEFAGTLRVEGTTSGRVLALSVAAAGHGPVTAQTEVVVGTLPSCSPDWPAWRPLTAYSAGDQVSWRNRSYVATRSSVLLTLFLPPSVTPSFWTSVGDCA